MGAGLDFESAGAITVQFESDDYAEPDPARSLGVTEVNILAFQEVEELFRHRAALWALRLSPLAADLPFRSRRSFHVSRNSTAPRTTSPGDVQECDIGPRSAPDSRVDDGAAMMDSGRVTNCLMDGPTHCIAPVTGIHSASARRCRFRMERRWRSRAGKLSGARGALRGRRDGR